MTNFYITNDFKLKKIYGYKTFHNFYSPIRGMYSTNLGGTEYLLVAAGGKLYYFLKSDLEDTWTTVNPNPDVPVLTDSYELISKIELNYYFGEIRTYAKYISQDEEANTTTYKLKVIFYTNSEKKFSSAKLTIDGTIIDYTDVTFAAGETLLTEVERTATHQPDGTSIIKSVFTGFENNLEIDGSTTTDIQFPGFFIGVNCTEIGNIPDVEVSFFTFDKKVYIVGGCYRSWDGTTYQDVDGYTPLVFINTPPAGGGVVYDEINMLTGKKHQTFNGDGTSTAYHLAQNNIQSVDKVLVDGEETSDYSVNLSTGVVTFTNAPQQAMDNVDIYWTLDDGDRHIIEGMKFGTIFGGDVDTRVFLYGNDDCQNRTYFSGLEDGKPSVEYFPATAQVDIGPSNFALTDLTRQYDRLLATTDRPEAYYLTIGTEQLPITLSDGTTTTRYVPSVATYPLNEIHGNLAPGQGQLINNFPVTIDRNSLIQWKATNVRDEKNMEDISQKIRLDLIKMDMSLFKTLDHQSENQLWFGSTNNIYIYNYFNQTYSRLYIEDDLRHLADLGNTIYMGTLDGKVMQWGEQYDRFDDKIIRAHWEMNFSDFDTAYLRKTMNRLWILMQPQAKSSADIGFITNRNSSANKKHIQYNLQVLDNVDFTDFSFEMGINPQPFRLKIKAKKFTNLKITIDNTEETDCTILQLVLKVESFGESK